jgi:hypothetical protein
MGLSYMKCGKTECEKPRLLNEAYCQEHMASAEYPKPCDLCPGTIESKEDLDWHGLGNCVPICKRCNGSGIEPSTPPQDQVQPKPSTPAVAEKRAMGQVTLWAMKNKVVRLTDRFTRDPRPKLPSKTLPGVGIFVKKMIFKPAVFLWQETTYYLIVVFVGGWYILKDWITGDPEISGEYYGPDPERKKK